MCDAPEKIEIVIGTDELLDDEAQRLPPLQYTPPTVDDVSVLLTTLAGLYYNGGNPIEAFDLDVIRAIRDRLDQLCYWAVEEKHAKTPEDDAAAAQLPLVADNERLIKLMVKFIETRRPKIVASVFRCLRELMQQPLRRGYYPVVIPLLCDAIQRFPSMEDVVEEATAAIGEMAKSDPEAILVSDAVSAVLQAMQTLPNHLPVHRSGCVLFAALVDGRRPDPQEAPAALLLVHIGVVVDFMCRAYQRQPQDTTVSAAVSHTLAAMSRLPQNRPELVSHRLVLSVLRHLTEHHRYTPRIVQDALMALSELSVELDSLQERTILLSLKELMMHTTETENLATCVALILKILRRDPESIHAFLGEHQIPQVIAIALDHFGEDDAVLRDIAMVALREMVISKLR
jgi:hypothetical protein